MEYARGRLFKDPSLPGMTAEERKVRVERGWGGGGGREFIRETNAVERRASSRNWQNMFTLTNFRHIEVLLHLFYRF